LILFTYSCCPDLVNNLILTNHAVADDDAPDADTPVDAVIFELTSLAVLLLLIPKHVRKQSLHPLLNGLILKKGDIKA